MTQSEAKEYLPLIKKWSEGQTLERKNCGGVWVIANNVDFSQCPSQYRIKPTETVKPWTAEQVPIPLVVRGKYDHDFVCVILSKSKTAVWLGGAAVGAGFAELCAEYEQLNGEPCGTKE